jgi:hypothetical protein
MVAAAALSVRLLRVTRGELRVTRGEEPHV